jgi:hypothetical protein
VRAEIGRSGEPAIAAKRSEQMRRQYHDQKKLISNVAGRPIAIGSQRRRGARKHAKADVHDQHRDDRQR